MKWTVTRRAAYAALVLLATMGIEFPASAQTPKSYTVTTLGGLPSAPLFGTPYTDSIAYALNNAGTVVGLSHVIFSLSGGPTEIVPRGVSWDATRAISDVFGTLFPSPDFSGVLQSINDANIMAGTVTSYTTYITQPTLFTPSGITPLQIPGTAGYARKVNNSNQTVGYYSDSNYRSVACLWAFDGTRTDLALPGSSANDINDAGTVVGDYYNASGIDLPFVWTSAGGFQSLPFVGTTATAYAINSAGTIAGKVDGHAVLWIGGVPTNIHNAGSQSDAFRVFDNGNALTTVAFPQADQSTVSYDCLNDGVQTRTLISMVPQSFTGTYINAQGINARGQIVGYTNGGSLANTAILLTPSDIVLPYPTEVTGSVAIVLGKPRYNPATKLWDETITVTNTSQADIAGPFSIVTSNLSFQEASKFRPFPSRLSSGSHIGGLYFAVPPPPNGKLAPGQSAATGFSLSVTALKNANFSVSAVLAGPGRP